MSLQREKKHSVCFWKKGSEPIIQKMILAVLTFLLIITVATSVFKNVYAYEPEYAQEDTLFIKTEEPQVNVIPNANTNSSLESAKHIKQKKKSKKKHKERKGVQFLITAYCPCCDCSEGYGKITSTGKIPKQGRTIAVDPKVIPYGTKVKIKGLGTFIVEDCGGAIKGNRIDIYFESHADTERFGVQRRTVFILGKDD